MIRPVLVFYEFFAGGGMVSQALNPRWRCAFANDLDPKKAAAWRQNWASVWGDDVLSVGDVGAVSIDELSGAAAPVDLAWASFPCQDLSLAGNGAGLDGARSGAFWLFIRLIERLRADRRAPRLLALENVCGALTSHEGRDFAAIIGALDRVGYRAGALVIDAALFLPHSRPRLFIIAADTATPLPGDLVGADPEAPFHTPALVKAQGSLPPRLRRNWIWWRLPAPPARNTAFVNLLEELPDGAWDSPAETAALLDRMSGVNLARIKAIRATPGLHAGTLYRRTRRDSNGVKRVCAEARFDGVAGCLRTPTGGSSRQFVIVVEDGRVRTRLITARETARLMGLPDSYLLPGNYNDAYHLTGDGVAVPVVRWLAEHILEPTSVR